MNTSRFLFLVLLIAASSSGFAQRKFGSNERFFSAALNVGINGFANPVNSGFERASPGFNLNANGAYMLNPWFGIRGDYSYNVFNTSVKPNMKLMHVGMNVLFDLTQINQSMTTNVVYGFNFQAYTGLGLATMWQGKFRSYDEGPYFIQGNDDMFFWNFGVLPKYRIDQNMTMNFDFSYVAHFQQDNYFDGSGMYAFKGYGGFLKFGIGLTYEFR
jgi:hypothetical protein